LSFKYVYPKEYQRVKRIRDQRMKGKEKFFKALQRRVRRELEKTGVNVITTQGRNKKLYSLYKKLLRKDNQDTKIYDLVAIRIIVKSVADCYAALGILHNIWKPVRGRIKDYISQPKPNGYQSLHTTVFSEEGEMIEFQIRTEQMHDEAQFGIAAHWHYDEQGARVPKKEIRWAQELVEIQKEVLNKLSDLEAIKIDFLQTRIFVFTPKGDVIDLPDGATPVDFAYAIHSDVGDHCVGARVNGRMVALDHLLQSGDVIEITTQKNKKPSTSWMEFIKSSKAKKKIKVALKRLGLRDDHIPKMTEFKITYHDRVGILNDITAAIARMKINIVNVQFSPKNKNLMLIVCEVNEKEKTEKLVLKIKDVKGVKDISWTLGKN